MEVAADRFSFSGTGPRLRIRGSSLRCRVVFPQNRNRKPNKPMTAKPSGTPIPTPMAVGRLVDCFWAWPGVGDLVGMGVDCFLICAAAEGPVEVMTGEDAGMKIDFAISPREVEEVAVTTPLELLMGVDDESVRGGNPKTWPLV